MTAQEIKDLLWRLDEESGTALDRLRGLTITAWKEQIEGTARRRRSALIEARNVARALTERIQAVIDELATD